MRSVERGLGHGTPRSVVPPGVQVSQSAQIPPMRAPFEPSKSALDKLMRGPEGPVCVMPRDLRIAFHRRLHELLIRSQWLTLPGQRGREPIRFPGASLPLNRARLDAIDARLCWLAADPAHHGKVREGGVEEAVVAVIAEQWGVMKPPVAREPTGLAEFVDADGVRWDVKSPISAPEGAPWKFDVEHQLVMVKKEIASDTHVLLNLTGCAAADRKAVLDLLSRELGPKERGYVHALVCRESQAQAA